jgi:hypothetical protein
MLTLSLSYVGVVLSSLMAAAYEMEGSGLHPAAAAVVGLLFVMIGLFVASTGRGR